MMDSQLRGNYKIGYADGYKAALRDVMRRLKEAVVIYEKDKANNPKPTFFSAVTIIGLMLGGEE